MVRSSPSVTPAPVAREKMKSRYRFSVVSAAQINRRRSLPIVEGESRVTWRDRHGESSVGLHDRVRHNGISRIDCK
jgi:hypothetical protein